MSALTVSAIAASSSAVLSFTGIPVKDMKWAVITMHHGVEAVQATDLSLQEAIALGTQTNQFLCIEAHFNGRTIRRYPALEAANATATTVLAA